VTLSSGIVIPDFRDEIEKARRYPEHCLYCGDVANSKEHPIPRALGGRLWAPILCRRHNGLVAGASDEGIIEQLHSLMHFVGARRQGGGQGAPLYGVTDEGERIKFDPQGRPERNKVQILERTADRKIKRASGPLPMLDRLHKQGALAETDGPVIALMEKAPPVTVRMVISKAAEKGVLKIALHFVAGFIGDVARDVARALWPYVVGDKLAGGDYVRTLPLEGRFFPASWPPQHRVAAYAAGRECFVTVLLFGMYGFNVRLPVEIAAQRRYIQPLTGNALAPILEENDHLRDFDWEDRLDEPDMEALRDNMRWRHDYLMDVGLHRQLRRQCRTAFKRATIKALCSGISPLACYEAELQIEGFSSEQVTILMHYARGLAQARRPLWDLPFTIIRS
jgi:hypothetical protein